MAHEITVDLCCQYNAKWGRGDLVPEQMCMVEGTHIVPKYDHAHLVEVTNDADSIQTNFEKYGVVQLRKLKDEKILLLGCGNGPEIFGSSQEVCDYRTKHLHEGCYTVDPDIDMNPSVVGQFGVDDFSFLPKESFDTIVYEGFMQELDEEYSGELEKYRNRNSIATILYLLKDGGSVSTTCSPEDFPIRFVKKNGVLVHEFGNIIKSDSEFNLFNFLSWNYR